MEQCYSDTYFCRRQNHVIDTQDVRLTVKDRERINTNHSLSKSHATFDHFDVGCQFEHRSLAAVRSITLENEIWLSIKRLNSVRSRTHSMAYALILQRRLSNQNKPDRPVHKQYRYFVRDVCFQQHVIFQEAV